MVIINAGKAHTQKSFSRKGAKDAGFKKIFAALASWREIFSFFCSSPAEGWPKAGVGSGKTFATWAGAKKDGRCKVVILALLLVAGAAVRLYGAWELRHNLNSDAGIVALMAKHMAEGGDFPIFFYGQAYMGSLEPMLSALLCAIFGTSGFAVTLGTALVSWLILLAVYLWARDAHSPMAGLFAVAFCVIGPLAFGHYGISPRGGYAVTILFATLLLWLGAKLVSGTGSRETKLLQSTPASYVKRKDLVYAKWFLLGLLAGLGWWSNQLIVSSILTVAILGLIFLGKRIFSLNTVFAAVGFVVGSLPFWLWNLSHDFGSFAFAGSIGQTPFSEGIRIFFVDRFPDLLDLDSARPAPRIIGTGIYLAAAAAAFCAMLRIKVRKDRRWIYLLTLYVFILVSALIFSTSHFARMNTSRYLLPLVPAVAVMLGVAAAHLAGIMHGNFKVHVGRELARRRFASDSERPSQAKALHGTWTTVAAWRPNLILLLCLLPFIFLIAGQFPCLAWLRQRGAAETAYQRQIEEAGKLLEAHGIYACYAPYARHAWNFALREKICFCDLPQDRYSPYAQRAELADRVAIFDNLGDIDYFIEHYGGSAGIYQGGGVSVRYGFTPPCEGWSAVSPDEMESITDSQENDVLSPLTDGNLDTCWESSVPDGDSEWLEIAFKSPQSLGMMRLLYCDYPETWQLEGQLPNGDWQMLTPCVQSSGYLWSGQRPYWSWNMDTYRFECRIPHARPEKFKRVRIHRVGNRCRLREIQVFSPAAAPAAEETSLAGLLDVIRTRGIRRFYCDRWPACAVYRETKGAVQTSIDSNLFASLGNSVTLTPETALLVRSEDAQTCRRTLSDRLIEMRETPISPWILFDFEPGKWKPEYGRAESGWAGFACFAKGNKKWAAELVRRADDLVASGACREAAVLLGKACRARENYQPAVLRLAKLMEAPGNWPDAGYWKAERQKARPEITAHIKFANGVEFCGISLSTNAVKAGEPLEIRYYWKYPADGVKGSPCVFVHFLGDGNIMQDDHLLEKFEGSDFQPYPEIFVETRRIFLSEHAPCGKYRITLGLYDASRKDLRRIAAKTALPGRVNAVELPATLTVLQ